MTEKKSVFTQLIEKASRLGLSLRHYRRVPARRAGSTNVSRPIEVEEVQLGFGYATAVYLSAPATPQTPSQTPSTDASERSLADSRLAVALKAVDIHLHDIRRAACALVDAKTDTERALFSRLLIESVRAYRCAESERARAAEYGRKEPKW